MPAIDQEIIGITRTVYGTYLQTIKNLGLPFTLIPNTTLNERFDVQAGVKPAVGVVPSMRYFAIGNLGHMTVQADDGSAESVPVPHRATDAGMYGQIPFALREVTNDLPQHLRDRYGLRVQEVHNGRNYFAYYLRRIDMTDVVAQLQRVEVIDGVATVTPFTPTTDNLNPVRPEISNSGVVLGSNSSESASAIVTVQLTAEDVAEILNAHKIRTGSTRSPVISEIALVSGVDKEVAGSSGGAGTFTYKEVIAAQINVHISTYHALGYATNGATFTLDVGGVEPTLGEQDVNAATFL
jgi:hypothetical protein